jgi:cell division protein FtsZ
LELAAVAAMLSTICSIRGIKDVNFVICNTDGQALDISPVPNKIQLGPDLTKGRGAGSHPSTGKEATMESMKEVKEVLEKNTEMVFVTAGMGGGTGTGGGPVIAKTAKDLGIPYYWYRDHAFRL